MELKLERPALHKGRVTAPLNRTTVVFKRHIADLTYAFSTGDTSSYSYYQFASRPFNSLAACKICNSTLKSDYFPFAATRLVFGTAHPHAIAAKALFLPYPIVDLEVTPDTLKGILALAVETTEATRRSAQFTIDFFQLNNREDLRRHRTEIIHTSPSSSPNWKIVPVDRIGQKSASTLIIKSLSKPDTPTARAASFGSLAPTAPKQNLALLLLPISSSYCIYSIFGSYPIYYVFCIYGILGVYRIGRFDARKDHHYLQSKGRLRQNYRVHAARRLSLTPGTAHFGH